METQLQLIIKENNLDQTKADYILNNFQNYFQLASEWETKAKSIIVTDEKQEAEMKMARAGRLFLREKRIAIEDARKKLKEQSLREGKAIDGIANVLKALIVPIEEYLEKQEKFVEIKKAEKLEALRIEMERKEEEERIAKEKAEAEERERIKIENDRLKKEAEEREKKHREEQAKAEAERKKQEEALRLEREKAEKERQEAERKRLEAEAKARAEQDRIKKEAEEKLAKERKIAEDKRRAEQEKAFAEAEKIRKENEAKILQERKERERIEAELKARKEEEARMIECPNCHHKFKK